MTLPVYISTFPKKSHIFFIYLCIGFAGLGPSLLPGYVFALDMVFGPRVVVPEFTSPSWPLYETVKLLSFLVPVWFTQKIILMGIFVGAGLAMHSLARRLLLNIQDKWVQEAACYAAGLLYIWNPFVYSRLIAGQFAVLLGYALLPLFTLLLWKFLERPDYRTALKVAGTTILLAVFSIHGLGLAAVIGIIFTLAWCTQKQVNTLWWRSFGKCGAIGATTVLIGMSYWLVPLLTGHGKLYATATSFGSADQLAFETTPGGIGLIPNLLFMHGFWGDDKNIYLTAPDMYSWWWVPITLILCIVSIGIRWGIQKHRHLTATLLLIGLLGLMLGIGTAGTLFAPINNWLTTYLPLLKGYREPQKFAALLILAYGCFVGMGTAYILTRTHKRLRGLICSLVVVCIIASAPLLPFGAQGQLEATEYPKDWYTVNTYLTAHAQGSQTLFLPWHLYMSFKFTNGIIANPASKFFNESILISNDSELDGAKAYGTDPLATYIGQGILPYATEDTQFADTLKQRNIRYIILAKDYDYEKYAYLDTKAGITKVQDLPSMALYYVQ